MYLGSLFKSVSKYHKKKFVEGICYDSRIVKKDDIFFAIEGNKISGTKYINQAILKGASAIVSNKKIKLKDSKIPVIVIKDVREGLSRSSSKFYKKKPENIIAVTGTNGKSSVADFFYQILTLSKIPVASIGTLGILSKNYKKRTKLTSLDPISLHKNLSIVAKKKINHVILEASSHGLKQKRLDNLNIKIGIFTNLSHDHLDYHNNMKSYLKSKMYLFKNLLNKNSTIITDEENKEFRIIENIANKRKLKKVTLGSDSGTLKILKHKYISNKQIVKISINSKVFSFQVPLIGYFQIKNLLMAILAALSCRLNQNKIFKLINGIKTVPGRLECVGKLRNNSNIIVDFAHTPDALEQALIALKKQFDKKIILVFGCGGERDKKKRYNMGRIAKKYCRKIFITDDNPRHENPSKIRSAIMKACRGIAVNIGSRKKAIESAINELEADEILLVAGKGHEKTQDYGKKIINFSDKRVIKKIIKKRKFYFKKDHWFNYKGVSINSKTTKKNNLFYAIKGKNTDGHKFVREAIRKGAIKCVVSKKIKQVSNNKLIKVKNTFSSLNNLAKTTRNNSSAQIIGITGSTGKTTLKNLVSFALRNYGKVYHSPYSYNNKIGVPLSVSNLRKNTKYGIFEIGMSKKGEIHQLTKITKPEIAVITNISEAHIENFNSIKDIAKAKAEIIDNVQEGGNIILNKNSKFFDFFYNKAVKKGIKVTSFGYFKKADIFLSNIKKHKNHYILKVIVKNKIFYFKTKYSENNFINNILACISVMFVLDLNLNKIKQKLINFEIPEGRGDIKIVKKFNKKFKFIDESYNANPLSMLSAVKNMHHFDRKKNEKKLIFLGDMLELGTKSKKLHRKLSNIINKSDIDKVFVYGKYIKETFNSLSRDKRGKVFKSLNEAYDHLGKIVHNNDLLMVKGSNATGLNQFSKNIKKGQIGVI